MGGYLFLVFRIYIQNVCLMCVLQINLLIMKKILGTIKTRKDQVESVELLSVNEMLVIRGGVEPIKPTTRPRVIYPFDE